MGWEKEDPEDQDIQSVQHQEVKMEDLDLQEDLEEDKQEDLEEDMQECLEEDMQEGLEEDI